MGKRIVVIVNKTWEAAPILGVFSAPYAAGSQASSRPLNWTGTQPYPAPVMWPDPASPGRFPWRYTLSFGDTRVECWCLADFKDTSDSIVKSTFIPQIVQAQAEKPDLVIAVGTAASVVCGLQGSVVVGCRAFMHDARPNDPPPASRPATWPSAKIDKIMESEFSHALRAMMRGVFPAWMTSAQQRMLKARNGASEIQILIDPVLIAVGDVNVGSDYTLYAVKDPESLAACLKADPHARMGSIETTSALIRAVTDPAPFLFISGIVNDMGQLTRDVNPTEYAQNFSGAHNAGVILAALLPAIVAQICG